MPLAVAARKLGKSTETLRRWVREGCPTASQGGPGRGKGARVDLDAVRKWRALAEAPAVDSLNHIGALMLDFWKRGCDPGAAGQRSLGIRDGLAAAFLVYLHGYLAVRLTGGEQATPEIQQLQRLAEQYLAEQLARQTVHR